jgi:hypothetical protein
MINNSEFPNSKAGGTDSESDIVGQESQQRSDNRDLTDKLPNNYRSWHFIIACFYNEIHKPGRSFCDLPLILCQWATTTTATTA